MYLYKEKGGKIVRCKDRECEWDEDIIITSAGPTKTMAPRTDRMMESFDMERPKVDVHDYYRNFCDAIDGKCEQLVKHDEMRVVMKVIMAAFESARTQQVVKF